MAATYSTSLATLADRIRFRLGDTDMGQPLLSDEEIAGALAYKSNAEDASTLMLALGLIRRYARDPDSVTADGVSFNYRERVAVWREMVAEIQSAQTGGLRIRKLAEPTQIAGSDEYGR
jgi:hypothetical protein